MAESNSLALPKIFSEWSESQKNEDEKTLDFIWHK
jgi:hypothetical protein